MISRLAQDTPLNPLRKARLRSRHGLRFKPDATDQDTADLNPVPGPLVVVGPRQRTDCGNRALCVGIEKEEKHPHPLERQVGFRHPKHRGPAVFQSRPRWQSVSVAAVQCSSRCRCHDDTHTRRSVQRTAATVDSTLNVCFAGLGFYPFCRFAGRR